MKQKTLWQAIKFVLFSISAGVIQIISFTLLNELLHLAYWPAYLTALTLSVLWNFTLNRKYTFQSASNVPAAMGKVFVFYLIFTPVSTYLGHIAEGSGVNEYIVLGATMLVNFVMEFLYQKFYVFADKK